MFRPLAAVFKKEMIEIVRGRLLPMLLVAPLAQVVIFGYVATTDIKHVETMIVDEDGSAKSRALTERFRHTEYFDVVAFSRTPALIQPALTGTVARIAVRIPHRFASGIARAKNTKVQLIVDGTNSNLASIALSRAVLMVRQFSDDSFAYKFRQMKNTLGELPSVAMEERVWYNPELKSANSMVPGVIGLILMIITLVVTSVSLVREKEAGNIEQLIVTPVRSWHIMAGKALPYVLIAFADIVLITLMSMAVFRITFEGSFILLMALSIFIILANLGLGIFISTVSSTQQQAMLSDIFVILPNVLLSGFIFPIKNMPEVLQWVTYVIPLRYYMVIIRGVFLKGLTFMELLPEVSALAVFSACIFLLAALRFRKKLS